MKIDVFDLSTKTCTTSNVIYALKCICQEFEYIGETKIPFCDRLLREIIFCLSSSSLLSLGHQQHGIRIMHEFILGHNLTLDQPKSIELVQLLIFSIFHSDHLCLSRTLVKDRMRLYRHSTLCSTAIQMFLQLNRNYWCCIPMKKLDAIEDDQLYRAMCTTIHEETTIMRSEEDTQWYIDHLPKPPDGYRFSQRQCNEQYLFFKYKCDLIPLSSHFHLYNATILFVCTCIYIYLTLDFVMFDFSTRLCS